jgi:hypothetical protein
MYLKLYRPAEYEINVYRTTDDFRCWKSGTKQYLEESVVWTGLCENPKPHIIIYM